jgi:Crinkler effector protein N-terminal domain
MSDEILIPCWIFGDEPNSAFPIRIAKYKTVSELRVAIKAQNNHAFQHVDTRSIALWKVSKAALVPLVVCVDAEYMILCTPTYSLEGVHCFGRKY